MPYAVSTKLGYIDVIQTGLNTVKIGWSDTEPGIQERLQEAKRWNTYARLVGKTPARKQWENPIRFLMADPNDHLTTILLNHSIQHAEARKASRSKSPISKPPDADSAPSPKDST